MDLQTPGVFTFLDGLSGAQTGQFARKVEQLGYSALWFPEVLGREPFSFASYLLSQTERLVIATGIVVPYAYEPIVIANATRTLAELFGDRFLLGLGVSNAQANARRGIPYGKPLSFTREYLAKACGRCADWLCAALTGCPCSGANRPIFFIIILQI